jgi:hypothetical protein
MDFLETKTTVIIAKQKKIDREERGADWGNRLGLYSMKQDKYGN